MSDLERLYEVAPWPFRPADPKAQARFASMVELFDLLLSNHAFFGFLSLRERVRILDMMSGSGIAGVALARALALRNIRVHLTVSDRRASDLQSVYEWLRGTDHVEAETVVADVSKIHEVLSGRARNYDVVLLWGLSTSHLDPWELARAYSSTCYLLDDPGVMAIDEADRIFDVFYRVGYKNFLTEGELGDGRTLVSIHSGYDKRRGTFKRTYYTLPGFDRVAAQQVRFWDLASVAAIGWLFFEEVDLIPPDEHKKQGVGHVILLKGPRRKVTTEDLKVDPKLLRTRGM